MANAVQYFGLTGDDTVDSLTTGYRWALDSQRTLSYSISDGFSGEYFLNPDQLLLYFDSAIQSFSQFADIRFQNVGQFASPSEAYRGRSDINLSIDGAGLLFDSPNAWALAIFFRPSSICARHILVQLVISLSTRKAMPIVCQVMPLAHKAISCCCTNLATALA